MVLDPALSTKKEQAKSAFNSIHSSFKLFASPLFIPFSTRAPLPGFLTMRLKILLHSKILKVPNVNVIN
jgi:hypothetical protein